MTGVFLRVYHLGKESFWFDEVASLRVAQLPFNIIMRNNYTYIDYANPPLYFIFLRAYTLFIHSHGFLNEFTARYPSFIFGSAGIFAFYVLVRKAIRSVPAQIFSFVLFLASAPLIRYSQIVKCYSLEVLFVVGLFIFCHLYFKYDSHVWPLYGIGIFSVCLLYTHYSSFVLLCLLFISLFTMTFIYGRNGHKRAYLMLTICCIALAFSPQVFGYFKPMFFSPNQFFGQFSLADTQRFNWEILLRSFFNSDLQLANPFIYISFIAICVSACLIYWYTLFVNANRRKQNSFNVFINIVMALFIVLIVCTPINKVLTQPYYYLFIIAPLYLWLGMLLDNKPVFAIFAILLWIYITIPNMQDYYNNYQITQFRDAINDVNRMNKAIQGNIIISPCFYHDIFSYYYPNFSYYCLNNLGNQIGSHIYYIQNSEEGRLNTPEELSVRETLDNRGYFVVLKHEFNQIDVYEMQRQDRL